MLQRSRSNSRLLCVLLVGTICVSIADARPRKRLRASMTPSAAAVVNTVSTTGSPISAADTAGISAQSFATDLPVRGRRTRRTARLAEQGGSVPLQTAAPTPPTPAAAELTAAVTASVYDPEAENSDVTALTTRDSDAGLKFYYRAEALFNEGKFHACLSDCTQAIEQDPQLTSAYLRRGETWLRKGNFASAISDYSQAILLEPDNRAGYNFREEARLQHRDFLEAIEDYTASIRLYPNETFAYFGRAKAHYKLRNYTLAADDYAAVILQAPEETSAYLYRGYARCEQRQFSLAIEDFTSVIQHQPEEANGYAEVGDWNTPNSD
jgi:regulator of sirC expression with transglutaminase-like and TPR domain